MHQEGCSVTQSKRLRALRAIVNTDHFDCSSPGEALHAPMPPMAPDRITALGIIRRLGVNTLTAFPARCFEVPVIKMRFIGRTLVIASSPDAMRRVLTAPEAVYGRVKPTVLAPLFGRGLSTSTGDDWRRQRRTLAPVFAPRSLADLYPLIRRVVLDGVAAIQEGGGRDLLAELQVLSLDIACTLIFSREAATFGPQIRAHVNHYVERLGRPTIEDVLMLDFLPTPRNISRRLFRKKWIRLIGSIIETRRLADRNGERPDMFDMLSDAYPNEPDLLLDEVANMISAGYESTAISMFWACLLLARSSKWQAAVAKEAQYADLSPSNGSKILQTLPVTRAVVQEALRLYPPTPVNARLATKDDEIDGVTIPRGAIVLLPVHMLHRNPNFWPAPDVFDPGRFLDPAREDNGAYLPFAAGRHTCIGAQLALTEATLVLANLVKGSVLSLIDAEPVLPVGGITSRPDRFPAFRLIPRSR